MATVTRFESLGAFATCAMRKSRKKAPDSREVGDAAWNGTERFEQAIELARNGWPDGAAQIGNMTEHVLDGIPFERSLSFEHGVSGSFVDVARYVSGQPECMVRFARAKRQRRIVRVAFESGARAGITADMMLRRGVIICALVDALETRNVRCEIDAYNTGNGAHHRHGLFTVVVHVKDADQPLDLDRLAFVAGHAAYHRRLTFGVREALTRGNGGHFSTTPQAKPNDCDIWVATSNDPWQYTDERILERVNKALASILGSEYANTAR